MLFSGAWGKMIREKNLKQKISLHCSFKLMNKGNSGLSVCTPIVFIIYKRNDPNCLNPIRNPLWAPLSAILDMKTLTEIQCSGFVV